MTATIEQQADEVGREVRSRVRSYPEAVARGRLRPETAERKIADLADAERTLRFIAQHARALRALCHFLIAAGDSPAGSRPPAACMPNDDEKQALLAHPGVRALLDAWPEAEVKVIGPVSFHTRDDDAPSGRLAERESEGATQEYATQEEAAL